jgi:ATP-binding cassette subfamily B (MDR/TAP) protein 6
LFDRRFSSLTNGVFSNSILVLKDGQIVEQGNHKELLALDGIFASMWADQVSSDDPTHSIGDTSIKREVSGYAVEELEPLAAELDWKQDTALAVPEPSEVTVPADDLDAVPEPSLAAETPAEHEVQAEPVPVAFPKSETGEPDSQRVVNDITDARMSPVPAAEPLTFPTTEDISSPPPGTVGAPGQGPVVTFGENVNTSRTGTPDPESEPKRKRISSQNFQRLARRISLTTRRPSSTSILPSLKRDNSPRVSTEGVGEGSLRTESPAGSIKGDADKGKKKKKDKKEQKEKNKKATT